MREGTSSLDFALPVPVDLAALNPQALLCPTMFRLPVLLLLAAPSAFATLLARVWIARAPGMKGIRFLGGHVENPRAATPRRRAAVVLGALAASYLACGVPFGVALGGWGRPVPSTEVNALPGRPAAAAGVASGDRVTVVAGTPIAGWDDIARSLRGHAGEPVEVVVVRGDETRRFTVTPEPTSDGSAKIGVTPVMKRAPAGASEIAAAILTQPAEMVGGYVRDLWAFAAGRAQGTLAGPAEIVRETANAADRGPGDVFVLLAALQTLVWPLVAIMAVAMVPRRRGR
jgi:hypothetical protein